MWGTDQIASVIRCTLQRILQLIAVIDDAPCRHPRATRAVAAEKPCVATRAASTRYGLRARAASVIEQFQLFCTSRNGTLRSLPGADVATGDRLVTGLRKPLMMAFSERDYETVRRLGVDHRAQFPRRIKE